MCMAVPSLAATALTAAQRTTRIVKKVPAAGSYVVVVSLGKPKVQETADVTVGSQRQTNIAVAPWSGAEAAFYVHANAKKLKVRVVGTAAPVKFKVATARQTSALAALQPATSSYTAAPWNPYHKLVWSDEFNGPAGSAPNPANWVADSGGGCGDNTLSTNTASLANGYLDGAGNLAISALPVAGAPGTYTSAQLDTSGLFSFTYGRIEARMELPVGQGLCSAFWMIGDSLTPTGCGVACGEIDIMEQGGQNPFQISATLHGPIAPTPGNTNSQQWQSGVVSATAARGRVPHLWRDLEPGEDHLDARRRPLRHGNAGLVAAGGDLGVRRAPVSHHPGRRRRRLSGTADSHHGLSGDDARRVGARLPLIGGPVRAPASDGLSAIPVP